MPSPDLRETSFMYLPVLTGLFTATLLTANVLNCKIIRVGLLPMTGGLIVFPLVPLLGDVVTEVYGYAKSRQVIWTALASLILLVVMISVCGALPADPLWRNQAAYAAILGTVPRIGFASLTSYFVGEFLHSFVLAKYKVRTAGKLMSVRFAVSTACGQAADSVTFVALAFAGTLPWRQMLEVSFSGWAIIFICQIAALPLSVRAARALKRIEGIDYFDVDTDFNPLHFLSGSQLRGKTRK
ncbi:MAG: queuosine precursor transporter [Acidobacteriaceae bacterium]|nr:queuosine precursor transporter [Acidobacteriaceae bacterium]MBV9781216.1 queuosine precursor transporter [Acidobacteriaceae bacterium]